MGMAKKSLKSTATILCSASVLALGASACSWDDKRSETLGGAMGGVLGGIAGSKTGKGTGQKLGIVLGATLGAMWGQDIAKGLNEADKIYSARTTQDTLEYGKPGETSTWSNPDSGHSGTVTADETYANENGENCRQFETTVQVDGESRTAAGTACKAKNGEWRVVDQPEVTS